MKICSVCKQEKELTEFYKQCDGKFGVTSRCKLCLLEANKKHYKPEMAAIYTACWKSKSNNKEKSLAANRKWQKNNLQYDAFRSSVYRARKKQQCPSWAKLDEIKAIYLACPIGYHVDHIIPLKGIKASGLHVENNLQYLLPIENLSKRNLYGW